MRWFDPKCPVGLVAVFFPAAVAELSSLGIDLAIEHDRPFADACAMRGLDPASVFARFAPAPAVGLAAPLGRPQDVWVPSAYLPAG